MKSKKWLPYVLLMISMFAGSCEKNPGDGPEIRFNLDKKAEQLISADNEFALELFRQLYLAEEKNNFMISPLSVSIALGMTYNGAENDTRSAFEECMSLSGLSRHEINRIHGSLITYLLKADPKITLEIANSIWVNHIFSLRKEFADTNQFYYQAEIQSLDFEDQKSVSIINQWAGDKTHQKITKILDFIPPQTAMYLINALYYYGTWKYEFNEKDNMQIRFNFEEGHTGDVESMKLEEELNFYSNEKLSMAELPYGDEKFSMIILLPSEQKSIQEILEDINAGNWNSWLAGLAKTDVFLRLPKFKFEYETLLNDPLTEMGLGIAFTGQADFSSMLNEPANLFISRVIHKTFVDVNEKGTEAAAVTAVEVGYTSVGPTPVSFIVDRPFIFIIKEKVSNAIIFMGKVGNPGYSE